MKKLQIFLLMIIVVGLGLTFTREYWAPSVADFIIKNEESQESRPTGPEINFDEIGHFAKDNPGMKPGVWFLIYEAPGAPALTAELLFDERSVCASDGQEGECPDIFLPKSSLTRVRGVLENGIVRVISAGDSFIK